MTDAFFTAPDTEGRGMIMTDDSNPFAHHTLSVRLPGIIREVQTLNPDLPDSVMRALDDHHDNVEADGAMPMLASPAPDYDDWLSAWRSHEGQTWQQTDWFFAETYFYRRLMEAVRWWDFNRDPFAPKKAAEVNGNGLWKTLSAALDMVDLPPAERLTAHLQFALWGNRVDLSHPEAMAHVDIHDDDLLVDDRAAVVGRVQGANGDAHIIADNAGTELAMDLVLADTLLALSAERVIVHLKMHPTFVSDAIVADVHGFIAKLQEHGGTAADFGQRLQSALEAGRLRLMPDFYWNSSLVLWDMPPRLQQTFTGALLVVIKGDANYRRMTGDIIWAFTKPFAEVTQYFPAPLLALRTLKSDTVVGLPDGMPEHLETVDALWRVNGKRGVIQLKP